MKNTAISYRRKTDDRLWDVVEGNLLYKAAITKETLGKGNGSKVVPRVLHTLSNEDEGYKEDA